MNLPADPKKISPGLLDSHHQEENPAGLALLVEMVTAEGRSPDEVAWELQCRDILKELALLGPLMVFTILGSFGFRISEGIFMAYQLVLWPALGFRLVWEPLRGRSPRAPMAILGDLFFVSASFLQSLFLAIPLAAAVTVCGGWLIQGLISRHSPALGILGVSVWVVLLPFAAARNLSASLVERDYEEEVVAALPPSFFEESLHSLSATKLWTSRLRTLFRAGLMALIAYSPVFFLLEILGYRSSQVPSWTYLLAMVGAALAVQHLARGFFYAAMADQTRILLEKRSHGPLGAIEADQAGATSSPALQAVSDQSHLSPRDLAWRLQRSPRELFHGAAISTGILFLGSTLVRASPGTGVSALALPGLMILLVSPLLAGRFLRGHCREISLPRRLLAGFPAALFVSGALLSGSFLIEPLSQSLGRGVPLSMLFILVPLALLEASCRVWAWGVARSLPGSGPPSGIGWNQRSLDATGETWRRALVVAAGTWSLGIATMLLFETLGIRVWRLSYGWLLTFLYTGLPFLMGVQVMLRSYLAEALPGRASLPAAQSPEESP